MAKWENFIQLKQVDFKKGWDDERDFDKWLVTEHGLAYLLEVTGIDIDSDTIKQQESVGGFKADIFAYDIEKKVVIIENQLGQSDHDHLGKMLTYAGGLMADTDGGHLIWIAEKIREEHRAALDWLNSHTDIEKNFFGLEIVLYEAGDNYFPQFNIVSCPNDWSRTEKQRLRGELTEAQLLLREFWDKLLEGFRKKEGVKESFKGKKTSKEHHIGVKTGVSGCGWGLNLTVDERRVLLWIDNTNKEMNKFLFDYLEKRKDPIEEDFGDELKWNRGDDKRSSDIKFTTDAARANRDEWDGYIDWMAEHFLRLKAALEQPLQEAKAAWDKQQAEK